MYVEVSSSSRTCWKVTPEMGCAASITGSWVISTVATPEAAEPAYDNKRSKQRNVSYVNKK